MSPIFVCGAQMIEYFRLNIEYLRSSGGSILKKPIKTMTERSDTIILGILAHFRHSCPPFLRRIRHFFGLSGLDCSKYGLERIVCQIWRERLILNEALMNPVTR